MPIWLRRWTFNEIRNHYEEEKEAVENPGRNKGGKQTVINADGTINTPELLQKVTNSKKPTKYS
jgi:hypothetical protein